MVFATCLPINKATDPDSLTRRKFGYRRSYCMNYSSNFMTRHTNSFIMELVKKHLWNLPWKVHWIPITFPFISNLVNIGVAYSCIQYINDDVVRSWKSSFDCCWNEGSSRRRSPVTSNFYFKMKNTHRDRLNSFTTSFHHLPSTYSPQQSIKRNKKVIRTSILAWQFKK